MPAVLDPAPVVVKHSDKSHLKEKGFIVAPGPRVQPTMMAMKCRDPGAAGHMVHSRRQSRVRCDQVPSTLYSLDSSRKTI